MEPNHYLGMSIAERVFSKIADLSPHDEQVPVNEHDLRNEIVQHRAILGGLREDLEDNPFSIHDEACPIKTSPSEDSIEI